MALRLRSLPVLVLLLSTAGPTQAARALPSDGSTLFSDRSVPASRAAAEHADLFTGSAAFGVPLPLPPGTGGLTPRLALRYTSGGGGASWVGVGWSLPLASISRSLRAGVPRYDDARDEFELDGARLVPAPGSGTERPRRYHRRRERFERIVHEADGSWTVTSPDGTRRRFGLDADARIEHPEHGTPFRWLLSEEEDLHGNVVRFVYDRRDPGHAYPAEIRYTLRRRSDGGLTSLDGDATRDRVVRFELEPRPDPGGRFDAGFERTLRHRLRAVHVTIGPERLRCWELRYLESPDTARSLLAEVALHGSDGRCDGSPAPTPPRVTRLRYRSNAGAGPARTGWGEPAAWSWPEGLPLVDASRQDRGVRLADVDGDGRPDLVKAYAVPGDGLDGHVRSADSGVHLNTGAGFAATPSSDFPLPDLAGEVGAVTTSFARDEAGRGLATGLSVLDLDGDGRADLAGGVRWLDPVSGQVATFGIGGLHRSTGRGFARADGYGDLADDIRFGLARSGLVEFSWLFASGGWSGSFSSGALPGPARFADLDGDALPEIVVRGSEIHSTWSGQAPPFHPGVASCRFTLSSFTLRNRGALRFEREPLVVEPVTTDRCGARSSLVLGLSHQPCDGRDDGCQRRLLHDEARSQRFLADGSYAHWHLHWELGNQEVDLDGDGLADHLSAAMDSVLGSESVGALLNDGAGGYVEAPAYLPPARFYEVRADFSRDLGLRLADLDGDGRVDLVRAAEGTPGRAWLNRGGGGGPGEAWRPAPEWALPEGWHFVDGAGRDLGVRLVDLDGDGMTDLVRSLGNDVEVRLARGDVPDLLAAAELPLGARLAWVYGPSTGFDHRAEALPGSDEPPGLLPRLPQLLPLVTGVEVHDGVGAPGVTRFHYAGGRFDAAARTLRGFRQVTATRSDGRETRWRFHQDEARAGLLESETSGDAHGPLREVRHRYTPTGPEPPFVSLLQERAETTWDGGAGSVSRTSGMRLAFDRFGNLVRRVELGEVRATPGEPLVDLDPADGRRFEWTYAVPDGEPERWIVDRPRRERVRDGIDAAAPVLRESALLYDGDTTGSGLPTRGLVTRHVAVRTPGRLDGPATDRDHDRFGNMAWERSPRANAGQGGGVSFHGVDSRFHTFPAWSRNAHGHVSWRSTATPEGCPLRHPAGAGLVLEELGPNQRPDEPGLRRCVDAFGRVVREHAPGDLTRTRISYDDTPGAASVTRIVETGSGDGARSRTDLLDGFGRVIATRRSGPGGRLILEGRSYDAWGRIVSETAPHFEDEPAPVTRHEYDVMDRRVRSVLPGADRELRRVHGARSTTVTDPNGNATTRHHDAFGRVVRVEEPEGAVTGFGWDALDRLVEVIDPVGARTAVGYDLLGRRTWLLDPDTGWTGFTAYDDHGNLLRRVDARGETTWSYDALDRPLRRVSGGDVVDFVWDTAPRGLGLLAERRDGAGTLRITAYDALGRVRGETQEVGGARLAFTRSFDGLGQTVSRGLPDGRALRFLRDPAGFLLRVESASGVVYAHDLDFDARGRLVAWTAGNGSRTRTRLDPETGRLRGVRVEADGEELLDRSYVLDAGDRVREIADEHAGAPSARRFAYDGLDRLVRAEGPFAAGGAVATLHYGYDAAGTLRCKAATALEGCVGGLQAHLAASTGSLPAHAPGRVGGSVARYDGVGNLVELGSRGFAYDPLGRLVGVTDAGRLLATHAYDAEGRRTLWVDRSAARPRVRRLVREDFEWDETRALASLHVIVGGRVLARETAPVAPTSGPAAAGGRTTFLEVARRGPAAAFGLAGAVGALACVALGGVWRSRGSGGGLAWRRRLAAGTAFSFALAQLVPAHALPDGDLDANGRLDGADALRALQIVQGARPPSDAELAHGDVAPLGAAPEAPPRIDGGDLVLLWRALRGDDVDGDGLDTAAELGLGASPFRADSDRDGLDDARERAIGTPPDRADADGDGLADGDELARGSDPLAPDTDEDGLQDGADPEPRRGLVFLHADPLGSTLLETRAGGGGLALLLRRAVYAPYGAALGGTPSERGFTGQRFEPAAGLYDYGARWYDPATGRFLQPDPRVPDPLRPRTLNRYAYAEGNPVGRADPTGHATVHFRFFGGSVGPEGLTGFGIDLVGARGSGGWSFRAAPFASVAGREVRLAAGPGAGPGLGFSQPPYADVHWGLAGPPRARGRLRPGGDGMPSSALPTLGSHQLLPADVLLTGDLGGARYLRDLGADPFEREYGHVAIVLEVRGDQVTVLSADGNGTYVGANARDGVGGRWWTVRRPFGDVDVAGLRRFAAGIPKQQGLLFGPNAYLGNLGGNVCSSVVACALRASGVAAPSPRVGNLVLPGDFRGFGADVGRIFLEQRPGWPR